MSKMIDCVYQVCFSSSKIRKNSFSAGVAPDPAGGAYDAPPDPVVGWGGGHPLILFLPRCFRRLDLGAPRLSD